MEYNATPFTGIELSPAQMLMGRRLKTNLIVSKSLLKPKLQPTELIRHKLEKIQMRTKHFYDRKARKTTYHPLRTGDAILYQTPTKIDRKKWLTGEVIDKHSTDYTPILHHTR